MHKIAQSGGFIGTLLRPLLKAGVPLIKNVLKPLAKSVLIPLVLTASSSATDAAIHKKNYIFGSGTTTLITLNEEMINIMKIVKSIEESVFFLIKGASKTIESEAKKQKLGFLGVFFRHFRCYFVREYINR